MLTEKKGLTGRTSAMISFTWNSKSSGGEKSQSNGSHRVENGKLIEKGMRELPEVMIIFCILTGAWVAQDKI